MSAWSYEGKRVVIVGCFSGMGEAAARELVRLGGEVHGVDIRESPVKLASFTKADLKDRASIDAAVEKIGGTIDGLFNCSGLPQTHPALDVMKVNFIGLRYWSERWVPRMNEGSGIVSIASNAAYAYQQQLDTILQFTATPDFDSAVKWVEDHPDVVTDGYSFSKQALVVWTLQQAVRLAKKGIRVNVTCPGPTDTPMHAEFEKIAPAAVFEVFSQPRGRFATPIEQAYPVVFLNTEAAGFISGQSIAIDGGFAGGVNTKELNVETMLGQAMAKLGK